MGILQFFMISIAWVSSALLTLDESVDSVNDLGNHIDIDHANVALLMTRKPIGSIFTPVALPPP